MTKFLTRLVALLVVLSLAWIVGGRMLAQRWDQDADRAWTALGTPMTAFAARFPRHGQNEPARKLDDIAARLGIALAPAGAAGRPQPSAADAKAFDAVRPDLGRWLDAQLGDPSDRIAAPPETLASFLSDHAAGVQYLVAQLKAGEPPVWEQDLGRLVETPIPFLKGHRALDQLLCASALEAQRRGRSAEALAAVEAAVRASASLQDRPELTSRVVELALAGTHAGTLRKLDGVPSAWSSESRGRDLRKAMIRSLQNEAWVTATLLDRAEATTTTTARIRGLYEKPYALLAAADYSRALAHTAAALQAQQACAFEPEALRALDEQARDGIGLWNVVGRTALPSVAALWTAVDRARFQGELTEKVLELKRLRSASSDGAWPRQVPGIESSTCPGNRWTYVVSAGGGAVLTASQSPAAAVPAVRYEGPPPVPPKAR
jgi:hypothetical protein